MFKMVYFTLCAFYTKKLWRKMRSCPQDGPNPACVFGTGATPEPGPRPGVLTLAQICFAAALPGRSKPRRPASHTGRGRRSALRPRPRSIFNIKEKGGLCVVALTSDTPHKQQLWTQGGECVPRPGRAALGKAATVKFRDNTGDTTHAWRAWLPRAAHEHVHGGFGQSSCELKTTQRSIHRRASQRTCAQPAAENSALKTASLARVDACTGRLGGHAEHVHGASQGSH